MAINGEDDIDKMLMGPGITRSERTNVGRFQPGHPGGPGRPVDAVKRALRRLVDPEAIAKELILIAQNRVNAPRDRLAAIAMINDRAYGKVPNAIAVDARVSSTTSVLPVGWASMSPSERHAFLDNVIANPAMLALGAGSDDTADDEDDEGMS